MLVLSREIYRAIIQRANQNTKGVKFSGNFNLAILSDRIVIEETSSYSKFDITKSEFVVMSETTSEEIAFLEENNRSDYIKTFAFVFTSDKANNTTEALQELRNYYHENPSFTIVEGGKTFQVMIKLSRANKIITTTSPNNGKFILVYQMKCGVTAYDSEKGYDSNQATFLIDGEPITYTNFSKSSVLSLSPKNPTTTVQNIGNKISGQGVTGKMQIIYDRSDVAKKLLKACDGNQTTQSRKTTFTITTNIDGINTTITAYIWGSFTLQRNGIIILSCDWAEA